MSKKFILVILIVLSSRGGVLAQAYVVEKSAVSFFHEASVEDIAATTDKSLCRFDLTNGTIEFETRIADFEFKKSLMKQHFNEKYMESDKFPKATFVGQLSGLRVDQPGKQTVKVKGQLKVHGVTREVEIPGTAEVRDGRLQLLSTFVVRFEDHHIKIPQLFWKTVAESVEVSVDFMLVAKGG